MKDLISLYIHLLQRPGTSKTKGVHFSAKSMKASWGRSLVYPCKIGSAPFQYAGGVYPNAILACNIFNLGS